MSAPGEVDVLRAIAAGSHQPREARRRTVTAAWQRGELDLRAALNAAYRQGTLDERERRERRDSASGRPWDDELAPGEADIDDAPVSPRSTEGEEGDV